MMDIYIGGCDTDFMQVSCHVILLGIRLSVFY